MVITKETIERIWKNKAVKIGDDYIVFHEMNDNIKDILQGFLMALGANQYSFKIDGVKVNALSHNTLWLGDNIVKYSDLNCHKVEFKAWQPRKSKKVC